MIVCFVYTKCFCVCVRCYCVAFESHFYVRRSSRTAGLNWVFHWNRDGVPSAEIPVNWQKLFLDPEGENSADMSNIEQILRAIDVPLQATVARRGLASRGKEI